MITVKVGEPKTKTIGDIWFDPTQRSTYRAVGLQTSNVVLMITWTLIAPAISIGFPINPNKDDVYIEPVNNIPNVFDGTNWIRVVPSGYVFPPFVPKNGDCWTESLSQATYIFFNGQWTGPISVANVSSQRSPPQIISSSSPFNFNLTPGAAAAPGNIIVTNPAPQFLTPTNGFSIYGPNNQMLIAIDTLTGVCSFGPGYTPDAAAQVFWRALAGASPRFLQNQIEGLVQDLKNATSRLAVAEGNVLKFTQAGYKLPEPQKSFDPMEAWERAMGIIK